MVTTLTRAASAAETARALARDLAAVAPRVPVATYRLQLTPSFGFADAGAVVPYLADLGISDVYTSPYLQARPGSTHGYDVVDYGRLNAELGGEEGQAAFAGTIRAHGLGHVLDFVPNHMGIGRGANPWWLDVLEHGQASPYADFFDIDWEPIRGELRGKVLLPILGDHFGMVLERGELTLTFDAGTGTFTVCYYDNPCPIAPPTYPEILRARLDGLAAGLPPDDPDLLEYRSIITALERLPGAEERDPERVAERAREGTIAKRRLADVVARSAPVRAAVEGAVADLNGVPGQAASWDALDRLLEAQSYRLAYWRVAAEEINYRRFFAINDLAAVRQEEPAVFAAAHARLLRLLTGGGVTGVRLDHPDGLWDPAGYARDVQRAYLLAVAESRSRGVEESSTDAAPGWEEVRPLLEAWLDGAAPDSPTPRLPDSSPPPPERPLYLLVEKILEHGEELPAGWRVHGTTGYEFANAVTGLFVDGTNRRAFDELYALVWGSRPNFADIAYSCKHLIMRVGLASEVAVLSRALDRIGERSRRSRDFTLNNLRDALREVIACFPVYRTYLVCEDGTVGERDRRVIEAAVREAKRRARVGDTSVLDFVRDVLLMRTEPADEAGFAERCRFGMKFQQLTGPIMAKGLEDTAFYRYHRLTALNEVGGDPSQFGTAPAAFHRQNTERLRRWPHNLLASSTHDTKRSEDVRARIAVLSEVPREWRAAVNRWGRLNRRHKTRVEGAPAPDRNDEYLLYQTLLGAWPFDRELEGEGAWEAFVDRMDAYLLKAIREAQIHSSWVNPDAAYEGAASAFVRGLLDRSGPNPFLEDVDGLRRKVAHVGALNALGMQLLKLTCPGVPDVYQGTELWDLSLVDPDNRRPVDYDRRAEVLSGLRGREPGALVPELVETWEDGRIKLHVTARALAFRGEHADLFRTGDYVPLEATGARREHVFAFARRADDQEAIVVVPRLVHGLTRGEPAAPLGEATWGTTALPLPGTAAGRTYRDVVTGATVAAVSASGGAVLRLAEVLGAFPVALLERLPEGADSSEGEPSS